MEIESNMLETVVDHILDLPTWLLWLGAGHVMSMLGAQVKGPALDRINIHFLHHVYSLCPPGGV
jgi:hypothetical protein